MIKQNWIALIILIGINGSLLSQDTETLYFSKKVNKSYEETVQIVKEAFKKQGFGVITEIDMHEKLKEKLPDIDVKPYKILGICNPAFAWETIQEEENIGLFLPCKVLVKQKGDSQTEVVVVNPSAMMQVLNNDKLTGVASKVTEKFKAALDTIE